MKDKVIRLANDIRVYILDELNYKEKKYVFGVEIDNNDEIIKDKTHALEVNINDDKLTVCEIEDFEIASIINNMFVLKMAEEE